MTKRTVEGDALLLEIFEWLNGGEASDSELAKIHELLFQSKVTVTGDDTFDVED